MTFLSEIKIVINGNPFTDFTDIEICQNAYGNSHFSIICHFDSMEEMNGFIIEKSKEYLAGQVSIQTKSGNLTDSSTEDALVFKGIITNVSGTRTAMFDGNRIVISGENLEVLLKSKPRTRAFFDKSLKDIVEEVLLPYDRMLLRPKISIRNSQRIEYIVQFNESDLDFLRRLACRFGEWFYHNGEELIFGENQTNEIEMFIGNDLREMTYSLKTNPLNFNYKEVNKVNVKTHIKKSTEANVDSELNFYGKFAKNKSQQLYGENPLSYYGHCNVKESDIENNLKAVVELEAKKDAISLNEIMGTGTNPKISMKSLMKIKISNRGNTTNDMGKYALTSLSQQLKRSLIFQCNFTGINAEATLPENTNPGLIITSGPQLAIVTENNDPEKLGRIRVRFSWMPQEQSTPWINLNSPLVGDGWGFYFIPSVNTLVVVNFEGSDVDRPYCEGAFYASHTKPDDAWTGNYSKNNANLHAIRTIKGNTIELHDTDGNEKIYIYDNENKNEIILDTAQNKLEIKGQSDINIAAGGKLTITASEVEMKSEGDIKITAGSSLKAEAASVKMVSDSEFSIEAANVKLKASASLQGEGSASAEVKSSGITTIQGSVVKIN